MALGDIFQLDNPYCELAGTDISDAVQRARLEVTHVEIDVEAAFGEDVRRTVASAAYSWMVEFEFRVDGFGGSTLDALITAKMHPPLGSGDGNIEFTVAPSTGSTTATNPKYGGTLAVSSWEPLGPGTAGAVITQTRTFKGNSKLAMTTS